MFRPGISLELTDSVSKNPKAGFLSTGQFKYVPKYC